MDNAKLAKLRVTPGKLLPSFASDVTQYSVTVSSSIEEVRISYQTSDSGASCSMRVSLPHIHMTRSYCIGISCREAKMIN